MTSKEGCNRFKNQVVVVTASTDGIGFAIARRIASEGAVVVISSRCKANVDEAVKKLESEGLNVKGVQCHVGNKEERMDLLRTATNNFKEKIDCLISNAAVSPYAGPTVDTPEPIFDKIFETNLKSSFLLTQDFRDWIKPNGNILYISSYIGYTPRQPLGVYAISKTALFGLTRAIAHDMWQQGKIRVNCIAPG
nr:dehydrogenase/reductase 4 [Nephromyces sp. MMRI]